MKIHAEAMCIRSLNHNVKCLNQEFLRVDKDDRNVLCRKIANAGEMLVIFFAVPHMQTGL